MNFKLYAGWTLSNTNYIIFLSRFFSLLFVSVCLNSFSLRSQSYTIDSLIVLNFHKNALNRLKGDLGNQMNWKIKARYYEILGKQFVKETKYERALECYELAKNMCADYNNLKDLNRINFLILQMFNSQYILNRNHQIYSDEIIDYATNLTSRNEKYEILVALADILFFDEERAINLYKNAAKFYSEVDSINLAVIQNKIGNTYMRLSRFNKDFKLRDSAYVYLKAAQKFYQQNLKSYPDLYTNILFNLGNWNVDEGNYDRAIKNFMIIDSIDESTNRIRLYWDMHNVLKSKSDYGKAIDYLELINRVYDSIKYQKIHLNSLGNYNTADQTLLLRNAQYAYDLNSQKAKGILIIIVLVFLIFLLVLVILLYRKNTTKKRKLLLKQQELKDEKIKNILKNQELIALDAMIAGQEKERQRSADDLHDNLGSLLATLKLHFQHLRTCDSKFQNKKYDIFEKTDSLLDEAYQKIRTLAHTKYAGLNANKGLLSAVRNFAAKVSIHNELKIEVIDYGINERLDNSLEIALFRIIQELVANVIKHSKAKLSTIHITNHDKTINILIEDDGIGFDTSTSMNKDGIGLHSIQQRVENLDGTLTVDSIIGNGTSIIIDIPLQ